MVTQPVYMFEKTSSEILAAGLKNEGLKSEDQIQEEIKANQKTAVDILKQIKERKKEITNHEKE